MTPASPDWSEAGDQTTIFVMGLAQISGNADSGLRILWSRDSPAWPRREKRKRFSPFC
jgi:hypothetical protein